MEEIKGKVRKVQGVWMKIAPLKGERRGIRRREQQRERRLENGCPQTVKDLRGKLTIGELSAPQGSEQRERDKTKHCHCCLKKMATSTITEKIR